MAKEKSAIERFAESKFMRKLQEGSQKLASNEIFSTISGGMGATMGLIMVGAVIQIVCAVGAMFGWDTSSASYQAFYMPYKLTMGLMGFFMCFSMAYNYAKRKKMNQMQSVVTALVCYILVVSPPVSASVVAADGTIGSAFDALNLSSLGTGGMFVAIIVGLCSVAISKFVIDHNWTIKLPDVVPEGIAHSFNAIIPMSVNIIVWYGISLIISAVSGGALTLSSLITLILSVPVNFLTSTPGMFVVIALAQLCWFFGIHGTGVIFTVLMVPYITAYTTNAALAAAGQPLQFFPVFLMGANGIMGGAGNTMPFSDGAQEQVQAHPGRVQGIFRSRSVRHQRACHLRLPHHVQRHPADSLHAVPDGLLRSAAGGMEPALDRLSAGADHDHSAGRVPDLPYYTGLAQRHLRDPDVPGLLADLAPLLQDL